MRASCLRHDVPFRGSLLLFSLLAGLFAFSGLGLGLVISVIARTQLQAQLLGMMVNFLGFFLAGFMFPVYSLPPVLRLHGLSAIWGQVAGASVLVIVIVFAASRLFRESLD